MQFAAKLRLVRGMSLSVMSADLQLGPPWLVRASVAAVGYRSSKLRSTTLRGTGFAHSTEDVAQKFLDRPTRKYNKCRLPLQFA
jgi:hypothetical protein